VEAWPEGQGLRLARHGLRRGNHCWPKNGR